MQQNLRTFLPVLILGLIAATALSGCGKKGDPQVPSTALSTTATDGTATTSDKQEEETGRPFFLDPLL